MPPRFLIDENLSPHLARHLSGVHGYDAVHVGDVGLRGASDETVLAFAIAADRVVMTSNGDDFRRLGAGRAKHPGLAILRDAVGRAQQILLGAALAAAIDQAPAVRGHIFEIDCHGRVATHLQT